MTAKFPSGERPTHAMFLAVERGNVSDVLLEDRAEKKIITFSRKFTFKMYFT